jgi:hypothetical protein
MILLSLISHMSSRVHVPGPCRSYVSMMMVVIMLIALAATASFFFGIDTLCTISIDWGSCYSFYDWGSLYIYIYILRNKH